MKKIITYLLILLVTFSWLLTNQSLVQNTKAAPIGQELFTSSGTWVAPAGVTSVSVVAIGGGGAGHAYSSRSSGGGGGGLGWKNNIAVIPGNSYTVVVGAGGSIKTSSNTTAANSGGDSYFIDTSTVAGFGGVGGKYNASAAGGGYTGDGGGNGGASPATASYASGGGGAGGYSGDGGAGGTTNGGAGGNGSGGGGGGGGGSGSADASGAGGGVGVLGEGSNGTGGAGSTANAQPGTGGSGGENGSASPGSTARPSTGGAYGGGGGAVDVGTVGENGPGGDGAVRIIWGDGRAFPSTNTGDMYEPTTTLGDGSNPGNTSIGPGASATDLDTFTLIANSGTDTVDTITATLSPTGAYNNISQVDITDNSNNIKCSVNSLASNTLNFTSCGLSVTTSSTSYKLRLTPKDHTSMPAPNGASYAATGTITSWTSVNGNIQTGTDPGSATVTVDNLSPNGATSTSGVARNQKNVLNWSTSNSGDFGTTSGSVIYRWAASSAGSEVPTEGSTPSAGDSNGTATVACVISSSASSAISKSDGLGGDVGCTTTALTNGQAYTYKVFQKDANGNYDTGVNIGTFTPSSICSSQTTGNWSAGSTWTGACSGGSGQPIAGDTVVVSGGTTVTVDGAQAASRTIVNNSGTLTFTDSSSLSLNGTSGTILTNNGTFTSGSNSSVIVTSPSSPTSILSGNFVSSNAFDNLILSPTITADVSYAIGTAFTANGDFTVDPTSSGSNSLTVTLGGTTTVSGTVLITAESSGMSVLDMGSDNTITTNIINIGAGGTLEANDSTITLAGATSSLTVTGAFHSDESTVIFNGLNTLGLSTIAGDVTFNNLQLENLAYVALFNPIIIDENLSIFGSFLFDNGNQITGNSIGVLALGAEAGLLMDSGLFLGEEEVAVSSFPTLFTRDHIDLDPSSVVYYASESIQLISDVPVYGNIMLMGPNKTINADITLTGSWLVEPDTGTEFTAGENTTVYLAGTDGSTQQITGNNTFYNLTATTTNNSSGRTIQFESDSTTTVTGTFTMTGEDGKLLILESTSVNPWTITPTSVLAQYLDVSNSINTNGTICTTNSINGGDNSGWNFSAGSCNTRPNTPTIDFPSNGAINQSVNLALKTTATDTDNDYLKYKIVLCEDSGMSVNCLTFDQTVSQTGWSGKNADNGNAYTSGKQAIYVVIGTLELAKTYYWKSYVIDPAGSNSWSDTQESPNSFTTRSQIPVTVIPKLKGHLKVYGGTTIK